MSALYFFAIPALSPAQAQAEFNQFMQQHRVVNLEKQWVADGAASFWSLCLTVQDGPGPLPPGLRAPGHAGQLARSNTAAYFANRMLVPSTCLRLSPAAGGQARGRRQRPTCQPWTPPKAPQVAAFWVEENS